jgi:hypothetical protein
MMTILRAALFSLLLINMCQASDDEFGGFDEEKFGTEKHQTPVSKTDIAAEIIADIQKMKPQKKSVLQSPLLNTPYNRADWPGLCIMRSLIEAIQAGTPEVTQAFKRKVYEVRDDADFTKDENWTFEYLNGQVCASLSEGI